MTDVSLITSLYQSEKFLPRYVAHVQELVRAMTVDGIKLEVVIIANAASDDERHILTTLENTLSPVSGAAIQVHYVPRETLYASWNRGVTLARSDILGFLNVDDTRTPQGIREGYAYLSDTGDLVDFAFSIKSSAGIKQLHAEYDPAQFSPKTGVSPFFMVHRRLINRAGAFNEHFRITGDFEFSKREAVRHASSRVSTINAGMFVLHGDNLSGGTNPLEAVEFNLALALHEQYHLMRPVDPELLQTILDKWGEAAPQMPQNVIRQLLGPGAMDRYRRYQWERNLPPLIRRIFLALAKRGLIYSLDWTLHHDRDDTGQNISTSASRTDE